MKAFISKNNSSLVNFDLQIKNITAGELLAMRNALSRYHTSLGERVSKAFDDAALNSDCLVINKKD